jgi:hypothetical protein
MESRVVIFFEEHETLATTREQVAIVEPPQASGQ